MNVLRRLLRLVGLAALILAPLTARAADPPPLTVYGNLPDVERMALSPSGHRLASIVTGQGNRSLVVMTAELELIRTVPLGDEKIRSLDWVGDDKLIVVISQTERLGPQYVQSQIEFFHAILVSTDPAQPQRVVFDRDESMVNSVFGTFGARRVEGRWLAYFAAIERERGSRGRPALVGFDVESHGRVRVAPPPPDGVGRQWLIGADGQVAASISVEPRNGNWRVEAPGGIVLASGNSPKGEVGLVSLGRDGRSVIYQERDPAASITRLLEVSLDNTSAPREFARAEDVERLFTDPTTGHLLGLLRMGEGRRPEFYDSAHQQAINRIYRAFPNLDVTLADLAPDFSRALVRTTGNGDSGTWYLVDLVQLRAAAVGYERVAIAPEQVGAISTVAYKAGDGTELSGILTLPPGRGAAGLPLVMLPHGGPHAHDEAVFDWWAQAFASRGYAVFQPNFRGSTNRDEAFLRAGFGQWGRSMQSDISDGIAELARQGIVDPARACIVGASYGGYAALAGVTLQQGLYRCAVAVAPVSDLASLFSAEMQDGGRSGMLRRSLLEELGPRSGFDAVSPRNFARQADAPILLIHGKDDTVVPFEQSDSMADALQDAGKPHRLVVLREEDHWLSRASTRLQMLEDAVAFVEEHNPPD